MILMFLLRCARLFLSLNTNSVNCSNLLACFTCMWTATANIRHQYYNMRTQVEPHYHVVEKAVKAMEMEGIKPRIQPIRGGTDGANLSFITWTTALSNSMKL